ncbi:hypothetical protein MAR_006328 [Mya arenaria]|uniref:Ribosomal protein L37 n=1 Tax=Mya arenaria TaxID=6604 RepID=A0ABY7DAP6_MYAAR|nr:hypothetical protein MAR_006328 [Mya arenaria]
MRYYSVKSQASRRVTKRVRTWFRRRRITLRGMVLSGNCSYCSFTGKKRCKQTDAC